MILVTNQGHYWADINYGPHSYSLAYTNALDITVIFEETGDTNEPLKFINYFYGGWDDDGMLKDGALQDATYYIDHSEVTQNEK